jgi:uncharacterized membrane protein YagU involved in acid resistance
MACLKMGLVAGVVATLVMDLGAAVLRKLGVTAGVPPLLFGRWLAYLARGQLFHDDIATSAAMPVSMPLALLTHYAIGVALAVGYVALTRAWPLERGPEWLVAVGYGVATSVFAWFLMFPAMGFGVFGARGPAELLLFRTSLLNHLLYGVGLAVFTTWLAPLLSRGAVR